MLDLTLLVVANLLVLALLVAVLVRAYQHVRGRFLARVEEELATGHRVIRNRMAVHLGRRYTSIGHVARAETMPGWVYIAMRREPPDPWSETMGWRPTRRWALRALRRRGLPALPQRTEAGGLAWNLAAVVLVVLFAPIIVSVLVPSIPELTLADTAGWLWHFGRQLLNAVTT